MSKQTENLTPIRLDMNGVTRLLQCHKATIYRRLKAGTFPKPTKIGCKFYWPYQAIVDYSNKELGVE